MTTISSTALGNTGFISTSFAVYLTLPWSNYAIVNANKTQRKVKNNVGGSKRFFNALCTAVPL